MNKQVKSDLPGIVSLTAILGGILLYLAFGEVLTGIKPNLTWIAWLTGFLFSLGVLWIWVTGGEHNSR